MTGCEACYELSLSCVWARGISQSKRAKSYEIVGSLSPGERCCTSSSSSFLLSSNFFLLSLDIREDSLVESELRDSKMADGEDNGNRDTTQFVWMLEQRMGIFLVMGVFSEDDYRQL